MKTIKDIRKAKKKDIIIENLMKCPGLYCLLAKPKIGKSLLALQITDCVANNKQFLGNKVSPAPVLYISTEMADNQVNERINLMEIDFNIDNFFFIDRDINNQNSLSLMDLEIKIKDFAEDHKGKLVIIDMISGINLGVSYDLNNYQDMGQNALPKLRDLADKYKITILFVHHLNKQGTSLGSTAIDSTVDGKIVLLQDERLKDKFTLQTESRDFKSLEIDLRKENNLILTVIDNFQDDDLDINLITLLNYVISQKELKATSGEITSKLRLNITPSMLTRLINLNISRLNKQGLFIEDERSANARSRIFRYIEPLAD